MMQLNDLGRVEKPCGLLGEMHGQHRSDREVWRYQHRCVGFCDEPRFDLLKPLGGEPRGTDHGVNSVVDEELQIAHHHVRVGEVDDDLGVTVR